MKSLRAKTRNDNQLIELWVGGVKIADNQGDGTLDFFSGPCVIPFNMLKYTPVGIVSQSELPEVDIEYADNTYPDDYTEGVQRRDGTRNTFIFTKGLFSLGSVDWT